ncbi:MAG: hypothetical protein ACOYM7_02310 [Paludibacter sp.]
MRLFKSKIINFSEADRLIEKYYEGLSTVEEEQKLQQFLVQAKLPEKYKAEQAIFGYLKPAQTKARIVFPLYIRQAAMVALVLTAAFTIQTFVYAQGSGYAIVNGKKITNTSEIKRIAIKSLREISSTNNEVEQGLKSINNSEIVQQQLEVFNGLDELK